MYDLNNAGEQTVIGDLIPDGTFARVRLTIKPGGAGIQGGAPMDVGLFTSSQSSDAIMLSTEMTVIAGPFAKRKLWQMFTIAGGKLDDKGASKGWNISKATFRAMIDSRLGLKQSDMSPDAQAKRRLNGLKELDGIEFAAKIIVEPAANPQYRDSNRIERVLVPGDAQYEAVMNGQAVPAEPSNRKAKPATAGAAPAAQASAPAWATAAAPAAAAAAAAKPAAGPAWLNG